MVFTNPGWPKVTPYQERAVGGPAFTAKWQPTFVTANEIARREMTAGTDVSISGGRFQKGSAGRIWQAGTDTQKFI